RARERAPRNVAVLCALSGARLEKNDGWGAVALAQEAEKIDPASADAALSLARAYDAVGLSARAANVRLAAAERSPQLPRARKAGAATAPPEAVALAPADSDVRGARGRHRLRTGDETAALAAFTRSRSLRPQNPSLREVVRSMRPEEQYATPYLEDAAALAK